ncbi:MAG: hypothetical protein AAF821_18110 [Cyanobacteria bacterium P01_D01_bin.156]
MAVKTLFMPARWQVPPMRVTLNATTEARLRAFYQLYGTEDPNELIQSLITERNTLARLLPLPTIAYGPKADTNKVPYPKGA